MGLIPEETIREIRERADIVAVVGQHVDLRKAGRNHKGLCPFHNEKSPSFNVNGDKQFYYCFGCQKKGDVFTFVMEYEGKSFTEAAETLAGRFGITIPQRTESPNEMRQRSERGRMLEINRLAADFYRMILHDEQRGAPGRRYLRERGVDERTAEAFHLGYAPDDWHALGSYLAAQNASVELACQVGLLVRQPRASGVYDRFRDRLMCPVILPGGEIAGFSGRLLGSAAASGGDTRNDAQHAAQKAAKYINSPESLVYKKSKLLFGLHRARDAFRRRGRAILVEGNFDVINLHQAGFEEAVAPLGTALAEHQVDQLRRLADEVVLLYDGDAAGRAASLKALEALATADVKVRIAPLPPGEDPDGMLTSGRTDELTNLLSRAQPGIEYFIHEVWSRSAASADGRAAALAEAARVFANVANPTKRDLITGTLAAAMGLEPELVRRALTRREASDERTARAPAPDQPVRPASAQPPARLPREELPILAILSDHPELLEAAEEQDVFSLLTDARLRDIYCAARQGSPMLSALEAAPEDIAPLVAKHVLAGTYASVKDPLHCLTEAVQRLRSSRRRIQLAQLQRQAEEAGRRGDIARQRELVKEILTTRRQVD